MAGDPKLSAESSREKQRFLGFRLYQDDYAVPLLRVKEVIALPDMTPVPQTPSYFLGIMNLRGQIISVVDLRLKLNLKAENSEETCVIICDLSPLCLGVVVSSVTNVFAVASEEIGHPVEIADAAKMEYVMGVANIDKKMVVIIDIAVALGVEDQIAVESNTVESEAA
jgi:purine-binding chemotaxis protein CheW